MMSWAEAAAKKEKITREEADQWALRSHQRAIAAQDAGKFAEEIVPVPVGKDKSGHMNFFSIDEGREEKLHWKTSQVKTCLFGGVCTAGNSSSENDGAAVIMLASEKKSKKSWNKAPCLFPFLCDCGN